MNMVSKKWWKNTQNITHYAWNLCSQHKSQQQTTEFMLMTEHIHYLNVDTNDEWAGDRMSVTETLLF